MAATITTGNLLGGPATDVKYGADASEVTLGGTLGPVIIRKEVTLLEYMTQQTKGVLKMEEITVRWFVSTILAEITLENIQASYNQVQGNIAGGVLTFDEDELGEQSLIVEGPTIATSRTFDAPKVYPVRVGDHVIAQDGQQGIEVEWQLIQNNTTKAWFTITDV